MFTADAHCDTLFAIAVHRIDPSELSVTAARLAAGGVGLQTLAMFAGAGGPADHPYEKAAAMLENRHRVGIPVIDGELPDAPPLTPHGVLSIEGGEILEGSLERLREFDAVSRIRMIALTWNNENEIGYPAKDDCGKGLKPFGKALLKEMDSLGVLPDVSHLNERGFWDVAETASLPPIASHSNLKKLCGHSRNLTDDQVRCVIERKGYIGINFYSYFLRDGGNATLDDVLRHIDGIAELGGIDVLGFGSDFDGIEAWPEGLANPADLPNLLELLSKHGYKEEDIAKIAGLNLWNVMKRAEGLRRARAGG